ncbi:hypothetical protein DFJ74DRAFT_189227 [Hyaloraphidium curvatum]|nr:hypothetical protein DFJ74DRAFT_189227 [Hyaloraphidium curvatum]
MEGLPVPSGHVSREEFLKLEEELFDARRAYEEASELEREIRAELEMEAERREAECQRLRTRLRSVEEQLERSDAKLRAMLEERGALHTKLEQLRASEMKLKRRSVSLEQDCDELESNLRVTSTSVQQLEEQYAAVVEENAWLLARVDEAEERAQRLKDANRELEDELAAKGRASDAGAEARPDAPAVTVPLVPANFLAMSEDALREYIAAREDQLLREEKDISILRNLLRSRKESKLKKLAAGLHLAPTPKKQSQSKLGRRISRLFHKDANQ